MDNEKASIINRRRGAVRHLKIHEHRGHKFVAKFFSQFTYCAFCDKFLWGFGKQGYKCLNCSITVHSFCHTKLVSVCVRNLVASQDENRDTLSVAHNLKITNYFHPTWCDHCGQLLWGLVKQGLKCQNSNCGKNFHEKCKSKLSKNCGINEMVLREIIDDVVTDGNITNEQEVITRLMDKVIDEIVPPASLNSSRLTVPTIDNFKMMRLIGKGSFGQVFLVQNVNSSNYFAMKALKKDVVLQDSDGIECASLERDIMILANKNSFLAELYCTFQTEDHLFFVMEFLNGGDLMFHVTQSRTFKEDRARFYAIEIACGLQFLHSKNIAYRDLKLDNILLDCEGHSKIADFGMCKDLSRVSGGKTRTFCGTPECMAPEIIRGQSYNHSVDWWSFGVLIFEMLTGYSPFFGDNEDELYQAIVNSNLDNLHYPPSMSIKAVACVRLFFERDPSKRLGVPTSPYGRIRDQPFFSKLDWDKVEKRQIEPPFKPRVSSNSDSANFDQIANNLSTKLSKIDKKLKKTIDPNVFAGFSLMNDNYKGRNVEL